MPGLGEFSLALYRGEELVYFSRKPGLVPLLECISFVKGKGHILHDKVIGLAAARLIAYSGIISEVFTPVASIAAKQHLKKKGIALHADILVPQIINKAKTGPCPMEEKAGPLTDEGFYLALKESPTSRAPS